MGLWNCGGAKAIISCLLTGMALGVAAALGAWINVSDHLKRAEHICTGTLLT